MTVQEIDVAPDQRACIFLPWLLNQVTTTLLSAEVRIVARDWQGSAG
jgi:hypothetical protein